jgi:hypothetical protein
MKTDFSVFKVFQQGDEYFELLNEPDNAKKYLFKQALYIFIFSFIYGLIMGSYNGVVQSLVTSIKIPVLIFLSLFICFPAFYVIQFMLGSRMSVLHMANMILSGFIVFTTIALSFSPIVLFFMITGNNYSFLKLLHVAIFIFAGIFGMRTIVNGLKYSCEKMNVYPKMGINVFKFWIIIFAFVSMQLAWNLRPFIGSKELPFELFREREGNFYLAVIHSVRDFISGDNQGNDDLNIEPDENSVIKDTI